MGDLSKLKLAGRSGVSARAGSERVAAPGAAPSAASPARGRGISGAVFENETRAFHGPRQNQTPTPGAGRTDLDWRCLAESLSPRAPWPSTFPAHVRPRN